MTKSKKRTKQTKEIKKQVLKKCQPLMIDPIVRKEHIGRLLESSYVSDESKDALNAELRVLIDKGELMRFDNKVLNEVEQKQRDAGYDKVKEFVKDIIARNTLARSKLDVNNLYEVFVDEIRTILSAEIIFMDDKPKLSQYGIALILDLCDKMGEYLLTGYKPK